MQRIWRPQVQYALSSVNKSMYLRSPSVNGLKIGLNGAPFQIPKRYNSSTPNNDGLGDTVGSAVSHSVDLSSTVATVPPELIAKSIDEAGFIYGHIMTAIDHLHVFADLPYWQSIMVFTIGLRVLMLPVGIGGLVHSSRMAYVAPAMNAITKRYEGIEMTPEVTARRTQEMTAVLQKQKISFPKLFMFPFAQIPVFLSMFWSMQEMGKYFPAMQTGGDFWFTDLTATDPTYILPALNCVSFLSMIWLGSDGMTANAKRKQMQYIFSGLTILSVPIQASMETSVLLYWAANNAFSITQSFVLKNQKIRDLLGVLPPPPVDPNESAADPFQNLMKNLKSNSAPEVFDANGKKIGGDNANTPPPPPPTTFTNRPDKKK